MADTTIWHNPGCSTSRHAMDTAAALGVEIAERRYLSDSPDRAELLALMEILDDPPADLVRKDQRFQSLGLDEADYRTAEQVADLLASEPRLIQRPVLIRGDRAIIGRPKDRAEEFLAG
jgi:arsenate reductase